MRTPFAGRLLRCASSTSPRWYLPAPGPREKKCRKETVMTPHRARYMCKCTNEARMRMQIAQMIENGESWREEKGDCKTVSSVTTQMAAM